MEFSYRGIVTKESKKIYDNILKIKKNDPFYICVQKQKVDFLSLGRTDVHHFTIQVEVRVDDTVIERIDLESFKHAVMNFRNNMSYSVTLRDTQLIIESELNINTATNSYAYVTQSRIPLLQIQHEEDVRIILNLPLKDNILHIEFGNPQQFKLLAAQIKALQIQRVQFEIIPEQNGLRLQSVFHGDGQMVMRYIFNNFKLISKCIMEREKFAFDSAEFINSMLDKDNTISFLLTNNGSLVLGEIDTSISTKSILSRIIMHEDY